MEREQQRNREPVPVQRLAWLPPGTCLVQARTAGPQSAEEPAWEELVWEELVWEESAWAELTGESRPAHVASPAAPRCLTQVRGGHLAMGVYGSTLYVSPVRPGLRPTGRDLLQAQALGWSWAWPEPPGA